MDTGLCRDLVQRTGKAWDSDEARRHLEAARADNGPMYATWVLILVCGLRRGELLGLARNDIDEAAGRRAAQRLICHGCGGSRWAEPVNAALCAGQGMVVDGLTKSALGAHA